MFNRSEKNILMNDNEKLLILTLARGCVIQECFKAVLDDGLQEIISLFQASHIINEITVKPLIAFALFWTFSSVEFKSKPPAEPVKNAFITSLTAESICIASKQ
jgi:hypothetical protein